MRDYRDENKRTCSVTSTIIAVSSVAVLVQIIVIISFIVFYRSKRTAWKQAPAFDESASPVRSVRQSGSVSEVTFRNVYDQKPGTLRAFHLNDIGSNSRCHIASVFQDPT